jgi:hypothetical protein
VLPGLPAMLFARPRGFESTGSATVVMGATTFVLATVAVLLGRRSTRWCIGTLAVLMLWASNAVFRA